MKAHVKDWVSLKSINSCLVICCGKSLKGYGCDSFQ